MANQMCCELEFSVPWGFIAAKSWNDPCGSPVIAVHGLQDNAGTFDRLIPLLPSSFYFVAIDLPGHGRSSHFPRGVPLNFIDCVTSIKRVIDHMCWNKCIYLGHSLGGQIGSVFAALFPENISKLIMLDSISLPILSSQSLLKKHRLLHDKVVDLEKKLMSRKAPVYTYEQALHRVMEHRRSKLTVEAAKTLMERSLDVAPGGYRFTTDQRLKFGLRPLMYVAQHLEVVEKIACPHLIVFASESVEYFQLEHTGDIVEAYKMKPNFSFTVVDGNHDVHNNHPERVAPAIAAFLSSLKSSL